MPNKVRSFPAYDSRTGKDIATIKSVDITEKCPTKKKGEDRVLVDFGQATEGMMFNVVDCYPGQDIGMGFFNFIHDLEDLSSDKTAVFCRIAKNFGLTPEQFSKIIREEEPQKVSL